jgi:hypothetical protein
MLYRPDPITPKEQDLVKQQINLKQKIFCCALKGHQQIVIIKGSFLLKTNNRSNNNETGAASQNVQK